MTNRSQKSRQRTAIFHWSLVIVHLSFRWIPHRVILLAHYPPLVREYCWMKILVLNCGSSSVKFQLIETGLEEIARNQDRILVRGLVEKIGSPDSIVSCTIREHSLRYNKPISSHKEALSTVFDSM